MKRNTLIICVVMISLFIFYIGAFATPTSEEDRALAEAWFEEGLRYRDLAIFMIDRLGGDSFEGYTLDEAWNKSIESFEEAIACDPDYADPYYELGRIYEYYRLTERAYGYYNTASRLGHEGAGFRIAERERNLNMGQEDEVTEAVEEDIPEDTVIDTGDMGADDLYRLGVETYIDDTEAAIDYFTRAIELDPDHAEAYFERGRCNEQLGNETEAYWDYLEGARRGSLLAGKYADRIKRELYALESDLAPDEAEAEAYYEEWLRRVAEGEDVGEEDVGEDDDVTIDLIPGEMTAIDYYNLAVSTANTDPEKAIEYLRRAIELNPAYYTAYMKMGELYEQLGDKEKALKNYTYACVYGSIPTACENADRLASEIADAEEEDEVSSGEMDAEDYYELGMDLFSDDPETAIMYFTEAIKLNPEYLDAYYQRGLCRYDYFYVRHNSGVVDETSKGLLHDAIGDFTTVIEMNPSREEAYFKRGDSYLNLFHYFGEPTTAKAISDFTSVIALDPNNGKAYNNRGMGYDMNNDTERAMADYETACSLGYETGCTNLEILREFSNP